VPAAVCLAAFLFGTASLADDLSGKGSIGASVGIMRYLNSELSEGANARPMLRLTFRYAWDNPLITVLETGYGWNAYGEGGDWAGSDSVGTLAVVTPVTAGLDYRFQINSEKFLPRVGAGLGVYLMNIRAGRDRLSRDPVTSADRKTHGLGFYGKGGTDYLINPSFVLNGDLLLHYAFVGDEEKFPSGFLNADASFIELRIGMSYYFPIGSTGPAPGEVEEGE
jgi:hypothetical protein